MRDFINIIVENIGRDYDEDGEETWAPHPDEDHRKALKQTGFWGRQGAGCIFLAKSTGRILLAHRSKDVEQPHTWGNWGGAINAGEDPTEAAYREAEEESGHVESFKLVPLYVFKKGDFQYFNFLAIIEHEFTPRLDRENQGYKWVEFGEWPQPLHFGLQALFNDPESIKKIKSAMNGA